MISTHQDFFKDCRPMRERWHSHSISVSQLQTGIKKPNQNPKISFQSFTIQRSAIVNKVKILNFKSLSLVWVRPLQSIDEYSVFVKSQMSSAETVNQAAPPNKKRKVISGQFFLFFVQIILCTTFAKETSLAKALTAYL